MNVVKGKIRALRDHVLVTDMNFEEQKTKNGIVLLSDDGKSEGVKPRWSKVYAIGHEQTSFKIGEWVLVSHGRWTRGITVEDENGDQIIVRRVEASSILASADERPNDLELGALSSTTQGQTFTPEMFAQPSY